MISERQTGPPIHKISQIPIPRVHSYILQNGIPVYEVLGGSQEAFKMEVITLGGRLSEKKKLVSRTVAKLIKNASRNYSQKKLAESIDYYGATLNATFNMDCNALLLFALNKHARHLIPILSDVYFAPVFSDNELANYQNRAVSNLHLELAKNDVVAYREFTDRIFGKDHIYGYNSNEGLYRQVTVQDLEEHYSNNYGTNNCILILSGKINDEIRSLVTEYFGQYRKEVASHFYQPVSVPSQKKQWIIKGESEHQSAIILGRRMFTKHHQDYPTAIVLNTILGGYFGSRLMKTIREDKGYTYNITSMLDILKYDGFFYIHTEVSGKNVSDTLGEIYREIKYLQTEPISKEELSMVKNYILGNALNLMDGAFKVSKWLKSLLIHDLDLQRGLDIIEKIKEIQPENIQMVAQNYLSGDELTELVVE